MTRLFGVHASSGASNSRIYNHLMFYMKVCTFDKTKFDINFFFWTNQGTENKIDELRRLLGSESRGLYICPNNTNTQDMAKKKSKAKRTPNPRDVLPMSTDMTPEDVISLIEADLLNTGLLVLYISYLESPSSKDVRKSELNTATDKPS